MKFHFLYDISFFIFIIYEISFFFYFTYQLNAVGKCIFLKKLKLNFAKLHYIRDNLVTNYISKIFTHEIYHITNGIFYGVFFSSLCAHNMLNLRKQIDCCN